MGLVILIPLVLAPIFIFIAVSRISNINNAPVVTYDVKVLSKRSFRKGNGGVGYKAVFEINGVQQEFCVIGYDVYCSLIPGDEGVLSCKDRYAIGFQKRV